MVIPRITENIILNLPWRLRNHATCLNRILYIDCSHCFQTLCFNITLSSGLLIGSWLSCLLLFCSPIHIERKIRGAVIRALLFTFLCIYSEHPCRDSSFSFNYLPSLNFE